MKTRKHRTSSPVIAVAIAAIFGIITALIACDTSGDIGGSNDIGGGDDIGGSASGNAFVCYDEAGNEYALAFPGSGARAAVSGAKKGDKYEITVSKNGSRIGANAGKIDNEEDGILTLLPDGASEFTVEISENRKIVRFPKAIPLGGGTLHMVNGSLSPTKQKAEIKEVTVTGSGLSEKLAWIKNNAESNTRYIVNVTNNEALAGIDYMDINTNAINYLEYPGKGNITILLKGTYTISLSTNGYLFYAGIGVTLELENITLQGKSGNNGTVVYVRDGALAMQGSSKITGNGNNSQGVRMLYGVFTMNGGEISGNTAGYGGGVSLQHGSTFRITNGTIYGTNESNVGLRNTATSGNATLNGTAQCGTFSGNTWNKSGDLDSTNNTIKVVNGVLQP